MNAEEMTKRFTYHSPKGDQPERYAKIRAAAKAYAEVIDELCPDSREKSVAFTQAEDSVFWANAAIARNE
jgi:hypothetical protein